jgi:hypothetical protein
MDFYNFSELLKEHKVKGASNVDCDMCNKHCGDFYIDGKIKNGSWANMCIDCWKLYGVGKLGTGFGQKFDNKTGEKLEG